MILTYESNQIESLSVNRTYAEGKFPSIPSPFLGAG